MSRTTLLFPDPRVDDALELMRVARRRGFLCLAVFGSDWHQFDALRHHPELRDRALVQEVALISTDRALESYVQRIRRGFDVRGIVVRTEESVALASRLQARLALSHLPSAESLARFRDKLALKNQVRAERPDVALCWTRKVRSVEQVVRAFEELRNQRGVPTRFVLKPNDGYANRHIGFFDDVSDRRAIARLVSVHRGSTLFEEHIEGDEYCINGQADANGAVHVANIMRYEREAANGRRNVYHYQWHVPASTDAFERIAAYTRTVLAATGLRGLPFHAECFVNERGVWLNEVGARFGGGHCADIMRNVHGGAFDPLELAIACAAGEATPEPRFDWKAYDSTDYVVVDGISREQGRLTRVDGLGEVEALPEFVRWDLKPRVGQQIHKTVDMYTEPYAFHLMAPRGADLRSVCVRAERAIRMHVGRSLHDRWLGRVQLAAEWLAFQAHRRGPARLVRGWR